MASESKRLRDSWVANSTAWCEAVREERIESRRLVTNAAVIDAIAERSPRLALDLACGEGWLARELVARGVAVTGVDASEPLITAAGTLGGGSFLVKTEERGRSSCLIHPLLASVVSESGVGDSEEDGKQPAVASHRKGHGGFCSITCCRSILVHSVPRAAKPDSRSPMR
jgi:SAM-dependent methyltransferase